MDELYRKCCKFIHVIVVKILIDVALEIVTLWEPIDRAAPQG